MSDTPATFSHYPAVPAPVPVRLTTFEQHPCVYLPNYTAQMRGGLAGRLPPELYHRFMDAGFRRSGRMIYQPICPSCRACRPLRVDVQQFAANKTQRRCWRQNQDLIVTADLPVADDEAFALYSKYSTEWHQRPAEDDEDPRAAFVSFLYDSPVDSIEFRYRNSGGKLLAVGIGDRSAKSLSSVYFYFDPAEANRSLGKFGALWEIEFARRRNITYYYLGYHVAACSSMSYKATFQPHQLLGDDGVWRNSTNVTNGDGESLSG